MVFLQISNWLAAILRGTIFSGVIFSGLLGVVFASTLNLALAATPETWNQWRGPSRDGIDSGPPWPEVLSEQGLSLKWRVELPPSYSGPLVSSTLVFVTGTENKSREVVYALDRATGKERWKKEWDGAMTVPFFAAANGSWIRSTPACDGESLYVAGMRDVLVCLAAETGDEKWRLDFPRQFKTALPSFGFVCSPLVDGNDLYVQAGASVVKLNKTDGKVLWRSLKEEGGMMGSAFSSPVIASLAGKRQLVVQTRQELAGLDLETGDILWQQKVPAFRGMNILTPALYGDSLFTSSYQNKSWLFKVESVAGAYRVSEAWNNNAQGYMSTPVIIADHAYLHLQNQRFTCIDLRDGTRKWTSKPFGKYSSLIAQGDRILALDQSGRLLQFKADPNEFQLLGEVTVSEQDTWAHLAICDNELFVRELNGLKVFLWSDSSLPQNEKK